MDNDKKFSKTRVLLLQLLILICIQGLVYFTVKQFFIKEQVFDPTYPTSPPPVSPVPVPKAKIEIDAIGFIVESTSELELFEGFIHYVIQPMMEVLTVNYTVDLRHSLIIDHVEPPRPYLDVLYAFNSMGLRQIICNPQSFIFQVIENETKFKKSIFLIPSKCYECNLTAHFINLSGSPGTRFQAMITHMEEYDDICLILLSDNAISDFDLESLTLPISFREIKILNSSKTLDEQVIEAEIIAKNFQILYPNTTIVVLCYNYNRTLTSPDLQPTLHSSKWYSLNKPSISSENQFTKGITLFYPEPVVDQDRWNNLINIENLDEIVEFIPTEYALWYDASMIFLKSNIRYGWHPNISLVLETAKQYNGLSGNCTISEDGYRKYIEYEMVSIPP